MDNTAFRTPRAGDDRPDLLELKDANVSKPEILRNESLHPANEPSGWQVEYIACYFIKNSGRDPSKVAAAIASYLNIGQDDVATRKRIEQRISPFVETVLPNRTLRVNIAGKEQQTFGPSSYSGISAGLFPLYHQPAIGHTFATHAVHEPPPFSLPSTTVVADETGWGVISDIDDTIKVTMTPSITGILHSTFVVETPQPITGMPDLYAHMADILKMPPFFYLSASPYNLYPFLRRFRDAHYPQGTIILRDASWQNLGGFIASLRQNTQAYKVSRMRRIHAWFPHRHFVCLGDSTQSDPEAYGEIARMFPGWVRAVFIRKVTDIAEPGMAAKNAPERFEKAFKGLDRGLWHVFTEPEELRARVEELGRDAEALVGGGGVVVGRSHDV
ncbi:hypothetical protein BDY17DRAFT_253187 [Neohortaea acidophila]|uniref:Phosphatidate phosphatase APP1 catalytic domain-containing protein n=1 Tax=Neohortaea acidophila TaxID=245834 RepID=A0A6A6PRY8_9PEZI|nr:uncharacterized protein BDY17DRAFT_253187 [Neohortaea acidophila]KAF2481987.1 hypothetical protein BDY17DRAFT_253187 [Neohortaea acidophila]